MREDLPPFARSILTVVGLAMAGAGALLWLCGCGAALVLGLVLTFHSRPFDDNQWRFAGLFALVSIVAPAIGSAMVFFIQPMIEDKPMEVPTALLPRWWLARFMRPMCLLWSVLFPLGAVMNLFRWSTSTIPLLLGAAVAICGYRYFKDQKIRLSPPYPPGNPPRHWRTKS